MEFSFTIKLLSLVLLAMGLLTMNHQVDGTEISTAKKPETPMPSPSPSLRPSPRQSPSLSPSPSPSLKPSPRQSPSPSPSPSPYPTPSLSTSKSPSPRPSPSPSSPPIVEIAKVTYRDSIIRIYTDSEERVPIRFFHEPIVQVDPKSITADSLGFLQKAFVSFTIEMWNPELRREILTRLQSLNGLSNVTIGEQNIHVLPFEKVRLLHSSIGNVANPVVILMDQPKSYFQQSESLRHYLLCDSKESANSMAEEFRQNPRFVLDKWHVTLVGQGLVLGNEVEKGVEFKYPVSTYMVLQQQG